MRIFALAVCFLGLSFGQQLQEGNFDIRFDPSVRLQTGAEIPFEINVKDDRGQPLTEAKVTLQIETTDHQKTKVFRAPAVQPGVYVAKPMFPSSGDWNVYVEVRRNDMMSAKTKPYSVPE